MAGSGGQYPTVKAALAAIGTALPASSQSSPYLIKVAPGVYDESGGIDLKNYVDIEGSGQDTTTLTCDCGTPTSPTTNGSSAAIRATGPGLHTEIRNLTVDNVGGDSIGVGIWTKDTVAGDVSIRQVTVTASGTNDAYGIYNGGSSPTMTNLTFTATGSLGLSSGIYNNGSSSPTMTNITATAAGIQGSTTEANGMNNWPGSSPTMNNVTAIATGGSSENIGIHNINLSSTTIRNSVATGATASISNGPFATSKVANSILSGLLSGVGTFTGSYGNVDPAFLAVVYPL